MEVRVGFEALEGVGISFKGDAFHTWEAGHRASEQTDIGTGIDKEVARAEDGKQGTQGGTLIPPQAAGAGALEGSEVTILELSIYS